MAASNLRKLQRKNSHLFLSDDHLVEKSSKIYYIKRKDTSIFLVSLLFCSFRVFSSSGDIKNGVMVTKFFLCSKKSDNRVYISYRFCHLLLCSTLMVMASLSSFWVWCRQVIVRLMTKVSRWSTIIFPTIFTSTGVWNEKNYLSYIICDSITQ